MSTTQLNDSLFNSSLHTCLFLLQDDLEAGYVIVSFLLISNFVVGLPANVWVVWLICRGTRELLALEIYLLSLAVCEILYCLGLPAQLYCVYSFGHMGEGLLFLLISQWILVWVGRAMFQGCICVDCYLAVVHPLIFTRLKPLKYSVAQCALGWCFLFVTSFLMWTSPISASMVYVWFVSTLCMFLYCYFSVLFSLKRPGPGEGKGRTGDTMKRKAFNLILLHLACFLVNYLPPFIIKCLTQQINISSVLSDLIVYLGIVCGHIQPLLYLHRAGKLSWFTKG